MGNPSVSPFELPRNLWNGWMCYLGYNSVVMGEHPDNCWPGGPLYVTLYLVANINFNVLIIMVSGRRGGRGRRWEVGGDVCVFLSREGFETPLCIATIGSFA